MEKTLYQKATLHVGGVLMVLLNISIVSVWGSPENYTEPFLIWWSIISALWLNYSVDEDDV